MVKLKNIFDTYYRLSWSDILKVKRSKNSTTRNIYDYPDSISMRLENEAINVYSADSTQEPSIKNYYTLIQCAGHLS